MWGWIGFGGRFGRGVMLRMRIERWGFCWRSASGMGKRWIRFWRETFAASRTWQAARRWFATPVKTEAMPASLVEAFSHISDPGERMVAVLKMVRVWPD